MQIGNLEVNGKARAMYTNASSDWHIDDLYKANPNEATALFAVRTPSSGGDTLFTGLRAAYEALDDAIKEKIKHLRCFYSMQRLDAQFRRRDVNRTPLTEVTIAANPPVSHPLVRVHPVTGKKGLLFSPEAMTRIEGMPEEASQGLAKTLADHALSRRFQYRHKWTDGDFLIWDNLSTMHRATEFDAENELRLLYRAIISRVR